MKKILLLLLSLTFFVNTIFSFNGSGSIVSDGVTRTFVYHSPGSSVAENLPVMIVLHGDGGTGAGIKGYSGFDAVADAKNFLAVYPDALYNGMWNRYADNAPGDACIPDANPNNDVLFISDLIDYLCTTFHIDINKVYVTGHSGGGYMVYNLAMQLSTKIAAFAPVSADFCGDNAFIIAGFAANDPVPIYHIHGDADGTVSYIDGNMTPDYEWPISAFSSDNCGSDSYTSTTNIVSGVYKHIYCAGAKEICLIQIVGGGHGWPNVVGYDAADAIVTFCLDKNLTLTQSCAVSINELNDEFSVSIFPNPSATPFKITSSKILKDVRAYDMSGKEIGMEKMDENIFLFPKAEPGVYVIKVSNDAGEVLTKKMLVE